MENYKLVNQACVECSACMHKACMLRLNSQDDVLPCDNCLDALCNNCYSLSQKYDLCEDCYNVICKKCQDREVNLDSNFDPKCKNKICDRCTHTVSLWKLRGIKSHLARLGINNDSSSSEEEVEEAKPKPSRMTNAKVAVNARAKPVRPVKKEPLQFDSEEPEQDEETVKTSQPKPIKATTSAKPKPRAPAAKKGSSEVQEELVEETPEPKQAKPKPRAPVAKKTVQEPEEEVEEEPEEVREQASVSRASKKPAPKQPILGNSANKAKPARSRSPEEEQDEEEVFKPTTSNKVRSILKDPSLPTPPKPTAVKKTSANTYGDPIMFE
jgi:hypothetical protein